MVNPKLYDCFTFFNELDLLMIRLAEHHNAVDYFVLVEATFTHQNNPKPLYFLQNRHLFKNYLHKIIHIVVDDKPVDFQPERDRKWVLENFQRNCIIRGLSDALPNDLILVSDVDEIIESDVLLKSKQLNGNVHFGLRHYTYFMNGKVNRAVGLKYKILRYVLRSYKTKYYIKKYWFGPVMGMYSVMESPQLFRNKRELLKLADHIMIDCGWHLSYLGGVENIIEKLNALNEEFDYSPYKNKHLILNRINSGIDLFNNHGTFSIDKQMKLPIEVKNNFDEYSHLFSNLPF